MNEFFAFMEGPIGRGLRVLLGVVLVYLGLGRMGGVAGSTLAVAGLLPFAMGLWGPCLARLALRRFGDRFRAGAARLETDPVCGMKVPVAAPLRFAHADKTYVFCAESCLTRFKDNPAAYVEAGDRRPLGPPATIAR